MTRDHPVSPLAYIGLLLALLAIAAEALSGLGTRWEWWNYGIGLAILRWAAYGGMGAALVSALAITLSSLRERLFTGALLSILGILIGLTAAGIPWSWMQTAERVPPIHDITTDTNNPPQFVAIFPLRKNAPNPAAYAGPDVAAQQLKAYPEIKSLRMNLTPASAFDKALGIAREMGWKIVDANENDGRIEAIDRTFWFGFHDDIVIRIKQDESGSRIDVRSASRVGKSDMGTNAKRIRSFLRLMH